MLMSFKKRPIYWFKVGNLKYESLMNKINESMATNVNNNNHKDTELNHMATDSEMNVAFVEQEPLVQDDARLGNSLQNLPPTLEMQMPDEHWMAAKQLSKPVVIQHFQWGADSTIGTVLNAFNFPQVISAIDSIHTETLNMYSFFKFNWNLKFQINGTKFHSGQLMASFDPYFQANDGDVDGAYRFFDAVYATGLPNVKLNASSNQPVEMTIPYVLPRNFMTTNSTSLDLLGRVRISVLNQLRYATGSSQNLSITVYLYATDPSVHVPIYRHLYNPRRVILAEQSMDFINSLGIKSKVNDVVGNVASGNFGGALKTASPVVSGLAKLLGLDYPVRIVHPQSHINPLGPMAHGKGVDQSTRLALVPESGHVAEPEQTGTTVDECAVSYISKVPMLFRQIVWSDTATVGTVLTFFPITPNIASTVTTDLTRYSNTFLSYLSNLYSYWQGSLDYNLELVSTQFHTGRLLIAFIPNYFATSPTLTQAYSCPYVVVDLQETSNVQMTVPFISALLMKNTDVSNATLSDENTVGYIYIYVLNPLVRPGNVDAAIEFNLYISGGEDFKLMVPRANMLQPRLRVPPTVIKAEQSIALDRMATRTSTVKEAPSISFAFGSPMIPGKDYFGEEFSLVDYMKRYGLTRSRQTIGDLRASPISVEPLFGTYDYTSATPYDPRTSPNSPNTPISSVQNLFACWSGSIRYKFATNANRSSDQYLSAVHVPLGVPFGGYEDGGGLAFQRTNLAQNNALEIECPCYVPYNFLLNGSGPGPTGVVYPLNAGLVYVDSAGTNQFQVDTYTAAGDDFRPFYLISPPQDFAPVTAQPHVIQPLRPNA